MPINLEQKYINEDLHEQFPRLKKQQVVILFSTSCTYSLAALAALTHLLHQLHLLTCCTSCTYSLAALAALTQITLGTIKTKKIVPNLEKCWLEHKLKHSKIGDYTQYCSIWTKLIKQSQKRVLAQEKCISQWLSYFPERNPRYSAQNMNLPKADDKDYCRVKQTSFSSLLKLRTSLYNNHLTCYQHDKVR